MQSAPVSFPTLPSGERERKASVTHPHATLFFLPLLSQEESHKGNGVYGVSLKVADYSLNTFLFLTVPSRGL